MTKTLKKIIINIQNRNVFCSSYLGARYRSHHKPKELIMNKIFVTVMFLVSFVLTASSTIAQDVVMKNQNGTYAVIEKKVPPVDTGLKVESGLSLTQEQLNHFVTGSKTPLQINLVKKNIRWASMWTIEKEVVYSEELMLDGGIVKKNINTSVSKEEVFNPFYILMGLNIFLLIISYWLITKKYTFLIMFATAFTTTAAFAAAFAVAAAAVTFAIVALKDYEAGRYFIRVSGVITILSCLLMFFFV